MNPDQYGNDLQARKAFLQERNRQMRFSRELTELGLLTNAADIAFLSRSELEPALACVRRSRMRSEWIICTWEEIRTELAEWLSRKGKIVSVINDVVAEGSWFAARLQELQTLWDDLYFCTLDSMSGYLVNYDPERGFEKVVWGD